MISLILSRRVLAVIVLLGFSFAAQAHTALKVSNPVHESIINASPEQIHLTFTAAVSLVRFSISAGEGREVAFDFKPSPMSSTEFQLPVPPLQAGSYKIDWAVIGADGHTVADSFGFTIDPSAPETSHAGHQAAGGHSH